MRLPVLFCLLLLLLLLLLVRLERSDGNSNQVPGAKVAPEDEPRRGMPEGILLNEGGYEPAVAYGQSKTANVLMAVGLNARLKGRVESFAVMPGSESHSLPFVSCWWYERWLI